MYMPRFNADVQKPKAKGANTMQTASTIESKKPAQKQELIAANITLLPPMQTSKMTIPAQIACTFSAQPKSAYLYRTRSITYRIMLTHPE